jgi:hypothetical protein
VLNRFVRPTNLRLRGGSRNLKNRQRNLKPIALSQAPDKCILRLSITALAFVNTELGCEESGLNPRELGRTLSVGPTCRKTALSEK